VSNSFRTLARAVTKARLQASDMRVGSGRANQFGSCPKLPTWTKPTPLSLAHSFKPRSIAIILLSNSEAGRAILGGSFILFRLGIAWRTTSQGIWFQGLQQRTSCAAYFTALARLSLDEIHRGSK
jgi:hypothetical protein